MTRSVVRDIVVPMPVDTGPGCACPPALRRCAHHDRLLAVETDPDAVLDLFELAVTWSELDYTGADVLPPETWLDFADEHRWRCPDRVTRMFALASDVALRGPRAHLTRAAATGWTICDEDILRGEL
jgi:hypothetical protein